MQTHQSRRFLLVKVLMLLMMMVMMTMMTQGSLRLQHELPAAT